MLRFRFLVLVLALVPCMVFAQKVVKLRVGSAESKAIMRVATRRIQSEVKVAIRLPDVKNVRRYGDWATVLSDIKAIDKKNQGDGLAGLLLHKVKGRWRVVDWTIGGFPDEDIAKAVKARHLPATLVYDR